MKLIESIYKIKKKPVPYYAQYPLWLIIWKPIRKFINVVLIPNTPFSNLRVYMYKYLIGYKIGRNVFIGMKCYLDDLEPSKMLIEDNVTISYGCYFSLHGIEQSHSFIKIKSGSYVGMRATIIAGDKGITIGENAIIGAASLVNKNVDSNSIVAGVPAKFIKQNLS